MAQIPAVCRTCGPVFGSGIELRGSANVTFSGSGAGPCPTCGGFGDIPDGVYDFVGGALRLLAAPTTSAAQLRRIAEVLRDARAKRASPAEVAEAVEDAAPGLSLAQRFLIPRNPAEFYAVLGIIVAAITLLMMVKSGGSSPDEGDIERIVIDAIEQAQVQPGTGRQPVSVPPEASPKLKPSEPHAKKAKRPTKQMPGRRDHRRRR